MNAFHATIPDGRAPLGHPIQISTTDARAAIERAVERIADLHTLIAIAWIVEQVAAGSIQRPRPEQIRRDHDCIDVFTGFDLAASNVRRSIHTALCMVGLRSFEKGLRP